MRALATFVAIVALVVAIPVAGAPPAELTTTWAGHDAPPATR